MHTDTVAQYKQTDDSPFGQNKYLKFQSSINAHIKSIQ